MMPLWLVWMVVFWQSLTWPQEVVAGDIFTEATVSVAFGSHVDFRVRWLLDTPPREVTLIILPEGQERVIAIPTPQDGHLVYRWDLQGRRLSPFSQATYWYQAVLADGRLAESPHYAFTYEDNRFAWQHLQDGALAISWVEGDLAFGQSLLATLQSALASVQGLFTAPMPGTVRLYVYPDVQSLQSALQMSSTPWLAGHASPEAGVILVAIPPGPDQLAEMERQIPHELVHLMQYQWLGADYRRLPAWLAEGVASLAELYPNPDYQRALERAVREDRLLPMSSLCQSFPRESAGAFLAYAQSASFTRFLHERYGSSGLSRLMLAYKDGLGCVEGVQSALGKPFTALEREWHEEALGLNPGARAWRHLQPYFILALLVMLPVALSLVVRRTRRVETSEQGGKP